MLDTLETESRPAWLENSEEISRERRERRCGRFVNQPTRRVNGLVTLLSSTKGPLKASGHEFTAKPISMLVFFSSYTQLPSCHGADV